MGHTQNFFNTSLEIFILEILWHSFKPLHGREKKSKNSINKRCPVIIWSSNLLSNLNSWYFLTPSQFLIHLHKFQIFQETKYRSQLPFFLGNNTERKSIYENLLEFSEIILCDSIILNILRQNTNSLNIFKKY